MTKKQPKKFYKKKIVTQVLEKEKLGHKKAPKLFPRISRPIPEGRLSRNIFIGLILLLSGFLLLGILLQEHVVEQYYGQLRLLAVERNVVAQDASYWQQVIIKYPDYRDAYLQLAIIEYQLGDIDKAKAYNQKALQLDLNYSTAKILATKLR